MCVIIGDSAVTAYIYMYPSGYGIAVTMPLGSWVD